MDVSVIMAKRGETQENDLSTQRIDKWLWYARVTKTRTLASSLVQAGKVRINRVKADKPGASVKVDDVVTIAVHGRVRVLRVVAPGVRRGPAKEAAELFDDLSPPRSPSDSGIGDSPDAGGSERSGGERPTKKTRRALEKLRQSDQAY